MTPRVDQADAGVAAEDLAVVPLVRPAARPAAGAAESHTMLHAVQSLLSIIIVAIFIITFVFQPFRIPSESMEPTLLVGDFLLVAKQEFPFPKDAIPFPATPIKRGDVIVFHYPIDPSIHLVKRVIGMPGDHLRLRDGHVYIDGRALDEPYAVYRPGPADNYRDNFPRLANPDPDVASNWWIQMKSLVNHGELTVPPHSFFVLGDNRNDSEDSRYWGFVPAPAIVGKPLLVYFSLNQAGRDEDAEDSDGDSGSETSTTPHVSALPRTKPKKPAAFSGILDFARWDRVLRVIR
jgi:signal peptidase I